MKPKLTLLLALAFTGGALQAQDQPQRPEHPPKMLPPQLEPFDANKDGRLDRAEWKAYVDAHRPDRPAHPLDKDGDGVISEEEKEAFRAELRERLHAEITQRFTEADIDENESLSLEEFTAALPGNVPAERAARLFDHCDRDDDDAISKEEFARCLGHIKRPQPPRPPKPQHPPRPDQPRPLPDALKPYDLNKDGRLSHEEIRAAIDAGTWPPARPDKPQRELPEMLKAYDTDGDGRLSPEEIRAAKEGGNWPPPHHHDRPNHRPPPPGDGHGGGEGGGDGGGETNA